MTSDNKFPVRARVNEKIIWIVAQPLWETVWGCLGNEQTNRDQVWKSVRNNVVSFCDQVEMLVDRELLDYDFNR
jgi:hypothetical protein